MSRRPPSATLTDSLVPSTTLFLSSRVDSYTSSPLADSRRFNAVSDTRAVSASVSCVQPSNARAARDCRAVIMHDHLPLGPTPRPELRLYSSFWLGKTSGSGSPAMRSDEHTFEPKSPMRTPTTV